MFRRKGIDKSKNVVILYIVSFFGLREGKRNDYVRG